MPLPDAAVAMERLLLRRRELSSQLLGLDAFERWGPKSGPEYEETMRTLDAADAAHRKVTAELEALSARTRAAEPAALQAWAEAKIALLEAFIAATPGEAASTCRHVAKEEIAGWRQVAAGERAFVDENTFYVQVDRDQHAALFGQQP